jgi:hypothetical protein
MAPSTLPSKPVSPTNLAVRWLVPSPSRVRTSVMFSPLRMKRLPFKRRGTEVDRDISVAHIARSSERASHAESPRCLWNPIRPDRWKRESAAADQGAGHRWDRWFGREFQCPLEWSMSGSHLHGLNIGVVVASFCKRRRRCAGIVTGIIIGGQNRCGRQRANENQALNLRYPELVPVTLLVDKL